MVLNYLAPLLLVIIFVIIYVVFSAMLFYHVFHFGVWDVLNIASLAIYVVLSVTLLITITVIFFNTDWSLPIFYISEIPNSFKTLK